MRSSTSIALALAVAAGTANAQLGGLSNGCTSAASSLLSGPFATCTNLIGLISVATASNSSVVNGVNSWITGLCGQDPCSSTTLSNATSSISTGCASDQQSGNALALGLGALTSQYNQVRNALCLQYSSNSTFCLTDLLTNYQTASGQPVTISTLTGILGGQLGTFFQNAPPSAYCTDCGHALLSELTPVIANISATGASSAGTTVASACGASFTDGAIPSSVKIAAKSASSGPTSSGSGTGNAGTAVGLPHAGAIAGVGLALLAVVGGALATLA